MDKSPKEILDEKTKNLAVTIYNLRQDLDLHRVIGLNSAKMKEAGLSKAFFGRVQQLALFSIAINIPKIYEKKNSRYELSSIPSILENLPQIQLELNHIQDYKEFEENVDMTLGSDISVDGLKRVFHEFCDQHKKSIDRLKTYRDKVGAHMEFDVSIDTLPSHTEFEALWKFANSFYQLIHKCYNNIGPAPMGAQTAVGLMKVLKALGIDEVQLLFSAPSA